MNLVEIEVNLPEDLQAFVRSQIRSGRYAYDDEAVSAGVYLLIQHLVGEGLAEPVEQPLEEMLVELRRTIAEQRRANSPEVIEAASIPDRWDEILARVEAGESIGIARGGVHTACIGPLNSYQNI